ncbi:MAG: ABC transporter substrate-binding protein, partial [Candidatus Binatia bacterium]
MQRRKFLVKAGGALVAAAAATAVEAPNVIARPSYKWRMVTSWPPALDVLQGNAVRFSRIVERMSEGRFKI